MFGGRARVSTKYRDNSMNDHFKHKKTIARNFFFSLLMFPLVSCGPSIAKIPGQIPMATRQAASTQDLLGSNCTFNFDNTSATITYEREGKKFKLELDVPDGVSFSKPIKIFCQERRTVIITKKYAIRALGHKDLAEGKQMLGVLADGSFNPQNTIIFNLAPLGEITDASAQENSVIVSNTMGKKFGIDMDNPSKPARHLPGFANNKSL